MSRTASVPDATGHFGPYGGVFVPETLIAALQQLQREYNIVKADPGTSAGPTSPQPTMPTTSTTTTTTTPYPYP